MATETRALVVVPLDGALEREIRSVPGLPYETWQESPVELHPHEWRLLTAAEEQLLFRQMNLAAYQASTLRDAILRGSATNDDRLEFLRLLRRSESIRDELVRAFSKLNLSIAGRFTNRYIAFDELVSEGYFTMLRAIPRFDPERGYRFSTYAMHAIRRRLLRFVHRKQRDRLAAAPWTDEAIPLDTRRWTLAYERRLVQATETCERMLAQLSSRERYVVRARYGWGRDFEPRTLREIAAELGISRERVRQLENRALGKLRQLSLALDIEL